jgi:tetratricopeptide (TPR) repeat protein
MSLRDILRLEQQVCHFMNKDHRNNICLKYIDFLPYNVSIQPLVFVDKSQREFLLILAYLYVRYGKYDEALLLHRGLNEFFEDDIEILLGLSFSLYSTSRPLEAMQYLEKLDGVEMSKQYQKLFFLLRSHVGWSIGRDSDARSDLILYLGLEESDIREQEANSGKEVEEYLS